MIAPVPVKQPWKIWLKRSSKSTTITKTNKTSQKPVQKIMGYTLHPCSMPASHISATALTWACHTPLTTEIKFDSFRFLPVAIIWQVNRRGGHISGMHLQRLVSPWGLSITMTGWKGAVIYNVFTSLQTLYTLFFLVHLCHCGLYITSILVCWFNLSGFCNKSLFEVISRYI